MHLANDVEPVSEQQIVVAVNAAAQRVLHGKHSTVGDPELHLELVAKDGVTARVVAGRLLSVHAQHAWYATRSCGSQQLRRRATAEPIGRRDIAELIKTTG